MLAATLLGLAALCGWMTLHPYTTYPLSLALLAKFRRPHRQPRADVREPLRFALCTCAYNEAGIIEEKARNLIALQERHPDLDILLYVDAASDDTARILQRYADRLRVVVASHRHGKTHGMNRLVGMSDADIIVFTDANVMLDMHAIERLTEHFADPDVGCVCGNLLYTNAADSSMAQTGSFYWKLEQRIKRLESAWGAVMGADGSLFAIRRVLHRPPPDHIIDDMYVSFNVLFQGYRVVQVDDVMAFERTASVAQEEFQRKVRIACQAFNVHRLIWPQLKRMSPLRIYMYVSHKLVRWFSIYFLVASIIFLLAGLMLAGAPMLAFGCAAVPIVVAVAGWGFRIGRFAQIMDIVTAFTGAGLGVVKSLTGELYQTWKPANSIRQ